MPRPITPDVDAVLEGPRYRPVKLAEFEFSAPVRYWTGTDQITFNGHTFLAVGFLGKVSAVTETPEIRAVPIDFELSGMQPAIRSIILGEHYQGRACRLWEGFMANDGTLVPEPVLTFVGRMNAPEIVDSGTSVTIRLRAENRLIDLERPRIRRYTDRFQQSRYPGDLFFEFVEEMIEKRITWPDAS